MYMQTDWWMHIIVVSTGCGNDPERGHSKLDFGVSKIHFTPPFHLIPAPRHAQLCIRAGAHLQKWALAKTDQSFPNEKGTSYEKRGVQVISPPPRVHSPGLLIHAPHQTHDHSLRSIDPTDIHNQGPVETHSIFHRQ